MTPRSTRQTAGLATAFLLVLASAAKPVLAQEASPRRASAVVTAGIQHTTLLGRSSYMTGGAAALTTSGPLSFGGAGWVLTSPIETGGETPGSELSFRVAYGGVHLRLDARGGRRVHWWFSTLLGAGNAKLSLPTGKAEIAADNFGVIQPDLGVSIPVAGALSLGAGVGYRLVFGVEDLPGLGGRDLRGAVITLSLTAGPF